MAESILFVDDEPAVLETYQRLLRKELSIRTALGGQLGLAAIQEYGPFAVVISDMRMPGTNGAEFLSHVRQTAPETVRMLLTGYTDIGGAIDAVNEGNIFRFLTKPCEKEVLLSAINAGLVLHRSLTAERELVRKAQMIERQSADRDAAPACPGDDFESPAGLPGLAQAKDYIAHLVGVDRQSYVVLLRLTALQTIEQRYGEKIAGDYLGVAAQFLVKALQPEDRLFHWRPDVLMAVVHRYISPAALRMEMTRVASANRDHVIVVNGSNILIASPTSFDLLPVAEFSTPDELLAASNAKLIERF